MDDLSGWELSEVELDRELVRQGGLRQFAECAWDQVESDRFVGGWHLDEISDHLEAVSAGHIRQLVINVPPGMSKSLWACVFWPVWEWITTPRTPWLFGSFDGGLTIRDSRKSKRLVESDWFRARWPELRVKVERDVPNTATEWHNTGGGWRFATSIGGKATGRHPDRRVIDDPTKPKDAMRSRSQLETALQAAEDWYRGTLSSRQANPKTSSTVLIMQRLHDRDLTGIFETEERDAWTFLRLPMRFEAKHRSVTRWFVGEIERTGGDRRDADGELLNPERYDETETEKLERSMGSSVAAAQLQQRPTKLGGSIFRAEWIQYWGHPTSKFPTLPHRPKLIQAWDLTFKGASATGSRRSWTVGQVWAAKGADFFLVAQERGQWEFLEALHALLRLTNREPKATRKLIEDAANGAAAERTLRRKVSGIKLVPTGGGSEARADAVSPLWESMNVWLPHPSIAPWVKNGRDGFIDELLAFPNGAADDQVDASTHALVDLSAGAAQTYRTAMNALWE